MAKQDQAGEAKPGGNLAGLAGATIAALIAVALTWVLVEGFDSADGNGTAQAQESEGPPPPGLIGDNSRRISGADRYETAREVSRVFHEDHRGVRIVALASGEDFPDALALGPNMSRADEGFPSGPVLLTRRDSLPTPTAEELQRLRPCELVIVGGTAAISDEVVLEADGFTDGEQDKC